MFYTYIIQSETTRKYYIGSSEDPNKRLKQHNAGKTKSLKNKGPFKLILVENFPTRSEAYTRELQIKSYKGGEAFKNLINGLE
jgi:putative endonuclease